MNTRRALAVSLLACPALVLCACSGTPAPDFAPARAALSDRTADGDRLSIALTAENPGREPLVLREVSYTVDVAGGPSFSGRRSADITLPAFGVRELLLPASFPAGVLPPLPLRIAVSGTVTYIDPGALEEALLDQGLTDPSTSFSGTVDITDAPAAPETPAP